MKLATLDKMIGLMADGVLTLVEIAQLLVHNIGGEIRKLH